MHARSAAAGLALRALLTALLLAGCAPDAEAPRLPWAAAPFPAVEAPPENPTTPEKVELGRLLFHDPILSSDRQVACVTCHGQIWGLSDGLPRSIGIGGVGPAGTGRTGPNATPRNAQTIWNAAFRATLFADGRAASLEEQVLFPLADPIEMGRDPEAIAADLREIPAYRALFAAAWPEDEEPIVVQRLLEAIAAFERTLVSDDAPYDRYVAGDEGALSAEAVRGMFLFAEKGCAECHVPPLFESDRYEPTAIASADEGRFAITGDPADRGRFRVPTLRNVRETAPYFHDGSARTLEEAIAAEARGAALGEEEVAAIATFLRKGLMDKSREPKRPLEVPSGLRVPLDGYQIPR
ncbi:cytochrome-c peroxidase [Vulgatibacter sp.]|uniref:cytochrome-c peroxidase n=1 Tax=Vulgatibacter sp. TaxID=1971226 RepID=UPI003567D6FE